MTYKHFIDSDICKGCGICVDACPKNVLEISDKLTSLIIRAIFRPSRHVRKIAYSVQFVVRCVRMWL